MVAKTIVTMNAQGRITVPASARRALHVDGEALFEVEINENTIVLRPVITVPAEDTWAYTPEHLRQVEEARQEGRGLRLTEDDLLRLMAESRE